MKIISSLCEILFPPKFMIQKRGKYWRVTIVSANRIFGVQRRPIGPKFETVSDCADFLMEIDNKSRVIKATNNLGEKNEQPNQ